MANIEELKVELDSSCRVCVINEGVLPIFGDEDNPDISMEIKMFGEIELHPDDDFPKYICADCMQLLRGAVTFRNQAKKADALLRRRKKKIARTLYNSRPIKEEINMQNTPKSTQKMEIPNIDFVSVKEDEIKKINELHSEAIEQTVEFEQEILEDHIEDELTEYENVIENEDDMVMLIVSDETKSQKVDNIHCKYCDSNFISADSYEEHRNSVEHKRNYVLSFLPKKRKNISTAAIIDKETVNPKDHKCKICDRMFTKLHYPRHMQTQHQVKMETTRSTSKKECNICKKMFHPVALNRHMKKAHTDEKDMPPKVKLECPVCKKHFSKDFYPLHMQRHNQGDTKNYICDQCGKKFFFKSTFYTHRLIHSNELPHKCEYCPYRGRTKGLLKTHVRTHTGDYPYQCTQCATRCLTKSNLNAHMQRHRGPVDFICDSCSRGFYSKLELQRHIAVIHQGIKNHVCNICGMAFGYRHGLVSHELNVHKRAKGVGKAKAVYLKLQEEGVLPPPQMK